MWIFTVTFFPIVMMGRKIWKSRLRWRDMAAAFEQAAKQVLMGDPIEIPEPEMIREKKFWIF